MSGLSKSRPLSNGVRNDRRFTLASEFDLIERYFQEPVPDGFLGAGDDCAMLPVPQGRQLVTTTDLLLEGRHFISSTDPESLGHKALAVNISDLAAMGAQPLGCLLGLALPTADPAWLSRFSSGFHAFAKEASCPLLGGDTTRSTSGLMISVTAFGHVDPVLALRRASARIDDDIWVSGYLGAADIALALLQGRLPDDSDLLAATRPALDHPVPPWQFATQLCGVANAALDISDGLVQDLGHILKASRCGANLYYDRLPIDPALAALPSEIQRHAALAGGDVYQLCFTAVPAHRGRIQQLAHLAGVHVTRVGVITGEAGLRVFDEDGTQIHVDSPGFDHFSQGKS